MAKKVIIIFFLALILVPITWQAYEWGLPLATSNGFLILGLAYLAFAVVESTKVSYNAFKQRHNLGVRVNGGLSYRVTSGVVRSKLSLWRKVLNWVSMIFAVISDSLAWPSRIPARFISSGELQEPNRKHSRKTAKQFSIFSMYFVVGLCWQVVFMLAFVTSVFIIDYAFELPKDNARIIYNASILYACAFLVMSATGPFNFSKILLRQPFNRHLQLVTICVGLFGIFVVSFMGLRQPLDYPLTVELRDSSVNFLASADLLRVFGGRGEVDYLQSFCSILLSITVVEQLSVARKVSPEDDDFLSLAANFLNIGEKEKADFYLGKVGVGKNDANALSIRSAALELKGDYAGAEKTIDSAVNLLMMDWPGEAKSDDREYIKTTTRISSPIFSRESAIRQSDSFFSKNQNSLRYAAVAVSLHRAGRMGWSHIFRSYGSVLDDPEHRVARAMIHLAQKRAAKFRSDFKTIERSTLDEAEELQYLLLSLVVALSLQRTKSGMLAATEEWIRSSLPTIDLLLSNCIEKCRTFELMQLYPDIKMMPKLFIPTESAETSQLDATLLPLEEYFYKFEIGRFILSEHAVIVSEMVTMPEHEIV